jgi:RNA polymerase sigma factor (sigma-70 family)
MAHEPSRYDFGPTRWSLVLEGQKDDAIGDRARNQLLERYHGAVNRYLLTRLGDPHAVDEVYEIYVDRVKENHPFLQRADMEKGRFRHYLRRILQNLIIDHYRRQQSKGEQRLPAELEADVFVAPPLTNEEEEQFRREWVSELMHHTWKALETLSRAKDKPFYDLMLFKAENPQSRSRQVAEHFSKLWGKSVTEANVRQMLHRGQELLSDLLLDEVAHSLEKRLESAVTADQVEEELVELQLLDDQRRAALARLRAKR